MTTPTPGDLSARHLAQLRDLRAFSANESYKPSLDWAIAALEAALTRQPAPSDDDLPGMWSHSDFTGGDQDERSHHERTRQPVAGDGISLITAERQRQIAVEGWTPEHDDEHDTGELAMAASVYARFSASKENDRRFLRHSTPMFWPWDLGWFKPGHDETNVSRIRELVKAGALIAAEIDRLQRTAPTDTPADGGEGRS